MTLSVCFDALGTCFTLQNIISAVDEKYGEDLAKNGWGSKGFVMDWFHSAQRDYTYLSLISSPSPPIASILKTSLPLSLSSAISIPPPSESEIEGITSKLSELPAAPTLKEAMTHLVNKGAKIAIITNGAKSTTESYAAKANISDVVKKVISCDDVGLAKPHKEVYESANQVCEEFEGKEVDKRERWFVAAHLWDLVAAKKAGFKTGLVLSEFPDELVDNDKQEESLQKWYKLYGGRPDVVGKCLLEVAQMITS
ncbi:haloacid dehalogenase, type II [Kwoniella pini CBS 10737]|uniref:Haloacid dehalogenase, type II n=1 Tax=Kwoniella pini CBS 10737 TaxID=1296096 RepID=A0A1B9I8G3_9TREE|nr:haloacid dehalogenase, type II [Kwoniella pini CBS 10737]OCF51882.1 haloacid dehalogenase, type II [Kwoniella pini CBS 10737]